MGSDILLLPVVPGSYADPSWGAGFVAAGDLDNQASPDKDGVNHSHFPPMEPCRTGSLQSRMVNDSTKIKRPVYNNRRLSTTSTVVA